MLRERYGEPVVRSDAAELIVTLDLGVRDAVRNLLVPMCYTLPSFIRSFWQCIAGRITICTSLFWRRTGRVPHGNPRLP
jgi:hypothetical protein